MRKESGYEEVKEAGQEQTSDAAPEVLIRSHGFLEVPTLGKVDKRTSAYRKSIGR